MNTEFTLIRARRRTVSLHMDDTGQLIVRAPMRMPEYFIHAFIEDKTLWITKNRELVLSRFVAKKELQAGESLLYRGDVLSIVIDESVNNISINEDVIILPSYAQSKLRILLEHWYKQKAKQVLSERVKYYAAQLEIEYSAIKLKDSKTRWGSCSSKGNLNFSWRLIMAPSAVLDYVVVHELAHRVHMNHSRDFWVLVTTYMPDYAAQRKWLKTHGHLLSL